MRAMRVWDNQLSIYKTTVNKESYTQIYIRCKQEPIEA